MMKKRDLLKVISAAGATGAIWAKPVVESVVLPVHAATTDSGGDPGSGTTCEELVPFDAENPEHLRIDNICDDGKPSCEDFAACMAESCIEVVCTPI